jgi:hypothetical protein
MNADGARAKPWYREPWPWILMSGPATVVVAGLVTAWLAVRSDDGLVADDYYKQGLAINRVLSRSEAAARRGIRAELRLTGSRVRVLLSEAGSGPLTLQLAHPTRAGMDQRLELIMVAPGVYEGLLQSIQPGRWHVVLERSGWRLAGDWVLPSATELTLGVDHKPAAGSDHSRGG